MASGFAPEFLILIGVDIFLGASILTVLLDRHFPVSLPYILDAGAMVGFGELLSGPSFISALSTNLQFYYSFAYALISVLTLFSLNLYLLFLKRRPFESAILGVFATVPASLGMLYFTSAFVNGLPVSLPLIPVIPIEGVYALFGLSVALIIFSLLFFGRKLSREEVTGEWQEPMTEEPVPARLAPSADVGEVPKQEELVAAYLGANSTAEAGMSLSAPAQTQVPVEPEPSPAMTPSPSAASFAAAAPGHSASDFLPEGARPAENPGATDVPLHGSVTLNAEAAGLASMTVEETEAPSNEGEREVFLQRLISSVKFFETVVDRPIRFDPQVIGDSFSGFAGASLIPGGIVRLEGSDGNDVCVPLSSFAIDEAIRIMKEAAKSLPEVGGRRA